MYMFTKNFKFRRI